LMKTKIAFHLNIDYQFGCKFTTYGLNASSNYAEGGTCVITQELS